MKIKKCTICGKEFESYNGMEVCSKTCAMERKHRNDVEGNKRRRLGISGEDKILICKNCGRPYYGLNSRYCSEKCRNEAHKRIQSENYKSWYKNKDSKK